MAAIPIPTGGLFDDAKFDDFGAAFDFLPQMKAIKPMRRAERATAGTASRVDIARAELSTPGTASRVDD